MTAYAGALDPTWAISDIVAGVYTFRKRIVRSLRFLLLLAILGMAYPASQAGALPWQFWFAAGLFFVSNIALHFEKTDVIKVQRLGIFLFLFDSALLAYMLVVIGERNNEYFALFALTVLMAAMSRSLGATFVSTLAAGAIYTLLTLYGRTSIDLLSAAYFTRLAFLFAVSLFVGYLSFETEQSRSSPRLCSDLYRRLFDMDASAILLCSRRLQVIQANPAAEAVLGYHLDALRGQPLDAILAFPAAARRGGGDDAAWPTGGMMVTLRRADGTVLDCLASTAEVPSSAGPLLLVVVHPETARRPGGDPFLARLEFQASLGALAHGAVNEAHGVLMRVLAACDRLPSRAKDPAVAALRAEAERVTGALREFMLYAQGTAGDRKSFAVGESVDRVLRLLAYELRARQVAVDWKPEPDLPPAAGDAAAFTQVVTGLVRNAADAAEPGPGSRGLRIRAGVTSGRVWVEVADDGPGIDPSIRPRLFEPFVTTKPDGTGLGLHAARRLLGDMGGAIAVEHGTSGGTTVRVELPAAAAGSIPAPRADGVESAPGRVYAWDHELVGVGTNGCNGAAHRKAS